MMEALPRSTSVIVDAIPTFLEKLQSIQCMDVAEQSLAALEMLSKKHHKAILHAHGVKACLMYLDFFSITAQRNALTIASNCCQALTPEEFVYVQDALAILSTRFVFVLCKKSFMVTWLLCRLVHEDKRSSESACLALSRLAESYKNDKNRLRDLAKADVLANLQRILVASPPGGVSANTFVTVLHVLVVMSSHGSEVGPMLLEESIGATLRQLLVGPAAGSAAAAAAAAAAASSSASSSGAAAFDGASSSSSASKHPPPSPGGTFAAGDDIVELVQRNPQVFDNFFEILEHLCTSIVAPPRSSMRSPPSSPS